MKYKDIIKCPENNAPNEKMKSLEDWTLGEMKEHCAKFGSDCENCCFYDGTLYCRFEEPPMKWELIPPPIETTIKWHKYPEDKGFEKFTNKKLLVIDSGFITFATKDILSPHDVPGVTAWAELPEVPNWDGD